MTATVLDEQNNVLMISPFKNSQRGNSITSLRLKTGLEKRGFLIDLVSLEDCDANLQVQAKLAGNNCSLIHALHARHWGRMLAEMPRLQELPIILTTTGTDLHYDLHSFDPLIKKSLFSARKIVLFHQDFKPLITVPYPELSSRLVVIPQGVFLQNVSRETFLPLDFNQDDFVFYLPSGLRPVKNLDLTLNALEMIKPRYPQLKLVIIGANIDRQYGRKILTRIQALPWITYRGEIPHARVRSVIQSCHAVINSSHFEGQPQGALEAMSMGLPCILTAVPGNLNIIKNGREGFYVQDEQELAEAAGFLMDNPQITKKMGQAAVDLVKTNFSLTKELDAYENLYRQRCE